jgi:hypothetical protein
MPITTMLKHAVVGLLLSTFGAIGCDHKKNGPEDNEDLTIVVEQDRSRIMEEEKRLASQQEQAERERLRLANERSGIERQLATLSKQDRALRDKLEADQKRVADAEKKLRDDGKRVDTDREKLEKDKNQLLARIGALTQSKGTMTPAEREEAIARREQLVAQREAAVAEREKEAAERITQLTAIFTELQKNGGAMRAVPAGASSGASAASRASVSKIQRDIDGVMRAKGILSDDLPASTRAAQTAGNEAFSAKDYATAQLSFKEVYDAVAAQEVGREFVKAKFQRVNQQLAGGPVDKKISALMAEVGEAFSDGRWDRANRKINQIIGLQHK